MNIEHPGDDGWVPECFGTVHDACGSEDCEFCPFEQECAHERKRP